MGKDKAGGMTGKGRTPDAKPAAKKKAGKKR
jgi:hypothetical protein